MTLMRRNQNLSWDPFRELETWHQELSRLFDFSPTVGLFEGAIWNPAIDIVDAKDHLLLKADIPGLSKEEIEVAVQNNNLILKGEKKREEKTKDKNFIREERVYGSFYRQIPLPANINSEGVKATYKNGVLELMLPKKEEAKPKQINVEVN